jgi:DNA-binding beta-propeller fold protein YncE
MPKRTALALMLAACGDPPPPPAGPTTPLLLVANTTESTLSILELPTGNELARLQTGLGPHEVAVSPDHRRAAISSYGDNNEAGHSLTVVDLVGLSVTRTIELDPYRRPHGIAFIDPRRVVVTSEANASVLVVDIDAGAIQRTIATLQEGSHMLALVPGTSIVYVANLVSGSITPIDLDIADPGEPVPTLPSTEAIAATPDGTEVWTASLLQNNILILDAPQLTVDTELQATGAPIRITPTPDGKTMIVSNAAASNLQLIDVATRAITTIDFPAPGGGSATPVGATVANDSTTAYVALVAENRVAVVDLASSAITGYLPVGQGPDGLAYCPQ